MKKLRIRFTGLLILLITTVTSAQDKADGFASVSGKGVETTTGGEGGEVIIAESYSILSRYATSDNPYVIIVKGTFESSLWKQINVGSNTTIVGFNTDATLKNIGLVMVDKQNIIIRNLHIIDSYVEGDWEGKTNDYDGIRVDNSHHVWIDHCFLSHLGDGLIDLRKNSDFITVSYNQLNNHNKALGVGWTDETEFHITIHHCWIDSTHQRNPSFDQGIGHLYNNYLSNVASYGNLSRGAARVVVQNSHFYETKDPLKLSDEAVLYSENNKFENCTGNKSGNITSMPFNPSSFYTYELDPVDEVKNIVIENSGPKKSVSDQYALSLSLDHTLPNRNSLTYFINQNSKTLTITSPFSQMVKLSIFSLDGKIIRAKELSIHGTQTLHLYDFKSGIYLIKLEGSNGVKTGKIIIN